MRVAFILSCVLMSASVSFSQTAETPSKVSFVRSKDGTRIAVECMGKGPSLLIVHGGTGDRSRWKPLLPLFASHFTVCAMDRRGHGESEAGSNYSLRKEFEDVAAVVNVLSRSALGQQGGALAYARATAPPPGLEPVFVVGHSIGGVFALEAAFLTNKISRLVLYEPPLQDLDHSAVADRMEKMIHGGDREQALVTFLREIVMISPDEIAAMKRQASWPGRVSGIDIQIREIRALSKYRFDAKRMRTLKTPTLLLAGSKTASPQLKQATSALMDTLPKRTLVVFEGQEHNAMDKIPQQFAETVTNFLRGERWAVGGEQWAVEPAKLAVENVRSPRSG
jgi:pimeloyl-ACP methyl ester carboxylesterase